MRKLALVLDIDGTVMDFVDTAARIVCEYVGPLLSYSEATDVIGSGWSAINDLLADYDLTPEWYWQRFMTGDVVRSMRPFPGAAAVLDELWRDGVDVQYVTAKDWELRRAQVETLRDNRFPAFMWCQCGADRLAIVEDSLRGGRDAVLVDDRPDTIEEAVDRGIPIIAPRHRYNAETIERCQVPSFDPLNWPEFHAVVEELVWT